LDGSPEFRLALLANMLDDFQDLQLDMGVVALQLFQQIVCKLLA